MILSLALAACFGCQKDASIDGCKGDEAPTILGVWKAEATEAQPLHVITIGEERLTNCENDNCQEGFYLFTGYRLVFGVNDYGVKELACDYLVLTDKQGKERRFTKE